MLSPTLKGKPTGLTKNKQARRKGPVPSNTLNASPPPHLSEATYGQPIQQFDLVQSYALDPRGLDLRNKRGKLFTKVKGQRHQEKSSRDSLDLLGDSSSLFLYQPPKTPEIFPEASRPSWFGASTHDQQRSLARSLSIGSSTSKALDELRKLHEDLSGIIESISPSMDSRREDPSSPYTPPKSKQDASPTSKVPAFGKPTAIHSPLVKDSTIFNVPKIHRQRPEHHRAVPKADPTPLPRDLPQGFVIPRDVKFPRSIFGTQYYVDLDVVEIPRPINAPPKVSYPVPPKVYSSTNGFNGGFISVNAPKMYIPGAVIDIPEDAIFDKNFGAADPFQYIDTEKAHKNIKALLEGAFEDDDDVPRTRRKRKLKEKLEEAKVKLDKSILDESSVKADDGNSPKDEDGDDEDEEDDGTVEGLKVKLLPHQIDGVAWMRDREITLKKRKGALPKGGLLADDVCRITKNR